MTTAWEIAQRVRAGESAHTFLDTALSAIAARNEELNVFLHVDEVGARAT